MSLTRPEGIALCSGQGEGVDPVPEDGAPREWACAGAREPGSRGGQGDPDFAVGWRGSERRQRALRARCSDDIVRSRSRL